MSTAGEPDELAAADPAPPVNPAAVLAAQQAASQRRALQTELAYCEETGRTTQAADVRAELKLRGWAEPEQQDTVAAPAPETATKARGRGRG